MKIKKGDVFKIETSIGYGFLQNIEITKSKTYYIRVLDYISKKGNISQTEVNSVEKWCTEFILNIALRREIVHYVGNFEIPPKFKIDKYARSKHSIRDEFLGWFIVDRDSLKLKFKTNLSEKELRLSPHGIMNDTYIIERLQGNWTLNEWK